MAKGRTYVVPHRRRREQKTDYRHRLGLLKSGKPRLVVRKSVRGMTCQVVAFAQEGDKCMASANSAELAKFGWKVAAGNIPAAYLTGLLCGIRAKGKGISEAVLDVGLYRSTKGGRLYAAVRGAVDAGLDVPHSKDILPPEDRTKGAHIAAYADWMKRESASDYKKRFSSFLKESVVPEELPQHFEQVKAKILRA